MRLHKDQQGITFIGLSFVLVLIGFVTFTTLKLLSPYMQNFYVSGALDSIVGDSAAEYSGVNAVRASVLKRLDVNDVTQVTAGDIRIVRDGQVYNIDIDYEVEIPYAYNISLILKFENHAEVPVR
jgi:hypothetical protein